MHTRFSAGPAWPVRLRLDARFGQTDRSLARRAG